LVANNEGRTWGAELDSWPKRDKGSGKKLHYVELYDLYSSPNIIRATKSRRWVGHVACTKVLGFWCVNLRERGHVEDPNVEGKIILKWIFKKWDGAHELV
jgi:hypothetical protein